MWTGGGGGRGGELRRICRRPLCDDSLLTLGMQNKNFIDLSHCRWDRMCGIEKGYEDHWLAQT